MAAGDNQRPQAELGGLSPDAVQRLLDTDWERPDSAIRLAERGGVKATPKGNLPRALVAAFGTHAGTTDAGGASGNDGVEVVALVRTRFRRLNLAYVDGVGPAPGFQYTVGYTLARFGAVGGEWHPAATLADAVLLPSVRAEVPARDDGGDAIFDAMAFALEMRVLRPLVGFGLVAEERPPRAPGEWRVPVRYRKTPLFDRLFRFDVTGPRRSDQDPRSASGTTPIPSDRR